MRKRTILLTTAAIAAVLALSACSTGTSSRSDDSGTPVNGGTLHIGVAADLIKVVPYEMDDSNSASVMSQDFEGLVLESDNGKSVVPGLASSYKVSTDGLTYTFDVRRGVKFHNGTALTAADIVWTLDQARKNPNTADRLSGVKDVTAATDMQVVVTLDTAQPDFLQMLTEPLFGIIPANFGGETESEFISAPIGTGPFRFASRKTGASVSFVKNKDYWGKKPHLDGVEYVIYKDVNAESLALKSGDIDMVDNAGIDSLDILQGTVVAQKSPQTLELMILNGKSPTLASTDLRRAISMAIDRKSIAKSLTGGYGKPAPAILTVSAFPKGFPTIKNSPYSFDVAAAKALVAKSGYDGKPISLIYSTGRPIDVSLAQVLQESLKKIGVTVTIDPMDSAGWLAAQTSGTDSWDLSITKTDGATATSQLGFISGTKYVFAGWPMDDVEKAIADFHAAATDVDAQQTALAAYAQSVADSSVLIPMLDVANVSVLSDKVKGFSSKGSQYYSLDGTWLTK